jgi:hypothetical protein
MKDSNRMPGGFALPADLERAMALRRGFDGLNKNEAAEAAF